MTDYKTSLTCQIPTLPEIYKKYFGEDYIGSFVEVGAYDGITYSNTYGLAELGWKGLYIEAVPEYYRQCVKTHADYKNIQVVNACVGDGSEVNLYSSGVYSTYDVDFMLNAPKGWGAIFEFAGKVKTETLSKVLLDRPGFEDMDLLVVDVEGSESVVLRGFMIYLWEPKMVIVEAHEQHHNKYLRFQADFINAYFARYDYRKIYSDDCNNIYVRCDG